METEVSELQCTFICSSSCLYIRTFTYIVIHIYIYVCVCHSVCGEYRGTLGKAGVRTYGSNFHVHVSELEEFASGAP